MVLSSEKVSRRSGCCKSTGVLVRQCLHGCSWESEHGQAVMVGASRRRERAAQVLVVRDC